MKQQASRSPPVFICPALRVEDPIIEVVGDESRHAMRARRLRIDDAVNLTNGLGLIANGRISAVDTKGFAFTVNIDSVAETPRPRPQLVLASALPKGERQSTMLAMATQLGMDRFIPLDCAHSVVAYQEKMPARWQRIVESACKQSRRSWFPTIEPALDMASLLKKQPSDRVVLYGDHDAARKADINQYIDIDTSVVIVMVGPEGGFSPAEQTLLEQTTNAYGLAIGNHILRTETAAIALLAFCGSR